MLKTPCSLQNVGASKNMFTCAVCAWYYGCDGTCKPRVYEGKGGSFVEGTCCNPNPDSNYNVPPCRSRGLCAKNQLAAKRDGHFKTVWHADAHKAACSYALVAKELETAQGGMVGRGSRKRQRETSDRLTQTLSALPVPQPAPSLFGGVASGLKWKALGQNPTSGTEIANPALSEALKKKKTQFTQEEWDAFSVTDLRIDHYVKVGFSFADQYFQPAGMVMHTFPSQPHRGQSCYIQLPQPLKSARQVAEALPDLCQGMTQPVRFYASFKDLRAFVKDCQDKQIYVLHAMAMHTTGAKVVPSTLLPVWVAAIDDYSQKNLPQIQSHAAKAGFTWPE